MSENSVMKKKRRAAGKNHIPTDHSSGFSRLIKLPLHAFVLTLFVECFNQGSLQGLLDFMLTAPLYFFYNVLVILTTLCFSELFKRRKAMLSVVSIAWIALGIAAFMVERERTQPFTSMDMLVLKDAITLTTLYYSWPQIILMFVLVLFVLLLVIWMIMRLPRRRHVNFTLSLSVFCSLITTCCCLYTLGLHFDYYPRYFDNLVDAYDNYGFAACFTLTFGDIGVERPEEYSPVAVENIVDEILEEESDAAPVFGDADNLNRPNIIFVQLESLFDVNTIIGSEYESDPTPCFNRLAREYDSGLLYVSNIGGGTANVEFEVLSGMNVDFFGAGEYPYTTILQESTCETIAYNLLEEGYATTAMHNHNGAFYSRNTVYSRMGFERFVSLEYMPCAQYTDVGWARDELLTAEVLQALKSTEARDFIMAITVESHGKYEEEYLYCKGDPRVLALPEQINRNQFCNYLRLIAETDLWLEELIGELSRWNEPIICVIYGDHLPGMSLTDDILATGDIYASRYIIWNNFGAEFDAPDLQAYRLSAHLLNQLGIPGGVISRYHQASALEPTEEYLADLELLQYDLLYGDRSVYEDGVNPYEPVDIQMGTIPIAITDVSHDYGRLLITGHGFTEYSVIYIDGIAQPTAFVSPTQLVALAPREMEFDKVFVAQITPTDVELSRTDVWHMGE